MKIEPEELRQDNNIGYWLFYAQRCVAHAFTEALRSCCVKHGKPYVITPPQWGVLALLYEQDGLPVNMIAQRRGLDAPTITGIVTRLEQNGLVERKHDSKDRRSVKVHITPEGCSAIEILLPTAGDFNHALMQGISKAEQANILAQLQQIITNVSYVAPGAGDRFGLLPDNAQHQNNTEQKQ